MFLPPRCYKGIPMSVYNPCSTAEADDLTAGAMKDVQASLVQEGLPAETPFYFVSVSSDLDWLCKWTCTLTALFLWASCASSVCSSLVPVCKHLTCSFKAASDYLLQLCSRPVRNQLLELLCMCKQRLQQPRSCLQSPYLQL